MTRSAAVFPWAEPVSPSGVFLLGLVLPYLLWTYLIGWVDLVHHTHPRSICFADPSEWSYFDATVRSTVHLILPFGLSRLTNNILEHTAHHVDPRVPLYNLPEVQGQLEATYPEEITVERLTPGYVLRNPPHMPTLRLRAAAMARLRRDAEQPSLAIGTATGAA